MGIGYQDEFEDAISSFSTPFNSVNDGDATADVDPFMVKIEESY